MKYSGFFLAAAAVTLLTSPASFAQNQTGQGHAVVTLLPAKSAEQSVKVEPQDVTMVKFNGKNAQVAGFVSLRNRPIELVVLIDSAARATLGTQMGDFKNFVNEIPPNTKMAFAYMEEGRAVFSGPLSSDPQQILKGLHLPNGFLGAAASPYFCISELARNWPSRDPYARRIVVMVSDGIDDYYVNYNPEDPYLLAAIHDSIRGGLIIYPFYWKDVGRLDSFGWGQMDGQNLLAELSEATGGYSYWEGFGNPVSFDPYFKDLRRRLENQYNLTFNAPSKGKPEVGTLRLNLAVPHVKVDAPEQAALYPTGQAEK